MMSPGFVFLSALKHGVLGVKSGLYFCNATSFFHPFVKQRIRNMFLLILLFQRVVQKIVLGMKPSGESRIDISQNGF